MPLASTFLKAGLRVFITGVSILLIVTSNLFALENYRSFSERNRVFEQILSYNTNQFLTVQFSNPSPISLPGAGAEVSGAGIAAPYSSNINVSGLNGTITDLNVRINGFSHTYPNDVAMLLVAPDGRTLILQSDVGGTADAVNVNYTFDDQAQFGMTDSGQFPADGSDVRPSSVDDQDFLPAPAPAPAYHQPAPAGSATLNNVFGGLNPNGTWRLFVMDVFAGNSGSIGGWSLEITTDAVNVCTYSLESAAGNFPTAGGSGNIEVSAPAGCNWTAGSDVSWITLINTGGSGSGTINFAVSSNPGTERSGSINIAGQIFTVTQSGNIQPSGPTLFDFDGDGKADVSVFRPADGIWYLLGSQNGFSTVRLGLADDRVVPADFDGDGKTDTAVFRSGRWYLLQSQNGLKEFDFGLAGDIPLPGDWDGDGKADPAVYRDYGSGQQSWFYYRGSLNNPDGNITYIPFGTSGDKPVRGDFDGDGRQDAAVFRPADRNWYVFRSSDNQFTTVRFGLADDKPVPADFDGDGKTDPAVYRPAEGIWYVLGSSDGFSAIRFGLATDLPVPADFDGDGRADVAVYRNGVWYILNSTNGLAIHWFGLSSDKPLPAAGL